MSLRLHHRLRQVFLRSLLASLLLEHAFARRAEAEQDAQTHLQTGVTLLQAGQSQPASEEFRASIRQDPQDVNGYIYLGIAENQLGHFQDAATVLQNALKLDKQSEAAHYNLALSLLSLKRGEEAARELQAVLTLDPGNVSASYNLGLLLADKGRILDACKYLEIARTAQPEDPAILIHLTDLYLKTGNQARALELVKAAAEQDSNVTVLGELGRVLVENNRFQEAVPLLEKVQRLSTGTPAGTIYLARAYLGTSQPKKAIELLAPISDERASWEVFYLRGLAFTMAGQRTEAEGALSKAVSGQPNDPSVYYALGKLLLRSRETVSRNSGVDEIREAIRLSPGDGQYYLTLATYYFDSGNLKATIELLKSALAQVPPSVQIFVTLGLAELELRGPTTAEPFIQKAISLDPRAGAGYDLLGRCRMRLGDYASAAKYYVKATELTPGNDIYYRDAAIALDKLGRSAEAVPFADQCVRLKHDEVYNHYVLGKLYSQVGRTGDAVRELEECVSLNAQNSLPYNLLAVLYKRAGENEKAAACWRKLRLLKEQGAERSERTFLRLGSIPTPN